MIGGWKLVAAERLKEIERLQQRVADLEDRLQSESLIELKAARRTEFAMPEIPDVDDSDDWGVDPIGNRHKLPALTPQEQRRAEALKATR